MEHVFLSSMRVVWVVANTSGYNLQDFFTYFQDKVSVKQFNYDIEIKGTVLEGDAYFGSEKTVKAAIPPRKTASYSDLVRYVLLHNYGGLW